jgi:tripartite-type tricarboxylate transporter receptor subunit TctC
MRSTPGRGWLGSAFGLALLLSSAPPSHAQDAANYPTRTIRLIVPTAPGGTMDIVARTLAQEPGPAIGAQVFIENKPGGNNNIEATWLGPRPTVTRCWFIRTHLPLEGAAVA